MDRGRKICDVLKAVRKKIADMNGIAYEQEFATSKDIAVEHVQHARPKENI